MASSVPTTPTSGGITHPYGVKTTSTGALSRSNSVTHNIQQHRYVPPSPSGTDGSGLLRNRSISPSKKQEYRGHRYTRSLSKAADSIEPTVQPESGQSSPARPLPSRPLPLPPPGEMDSDGLPPDPKEWNPAHVAIHLQRAPEVVDAGQGVVNALATYVRDKSITGRIFLRLKEEDLQGLSPILRSPLLLASRTLRQGHMRARIWQPTAMSPTHIHSPSPSYAYSPNNSAEHLMGLDSDLRLDGQGRTKLFGPRRSESTSSSLSSSSASSDVDKEKEDTPGRRRIREVPGRVRGIVEGLERTTSQSSRVTDPLEESHSQQNSVLEHDDSPNGPVSSHPLHDITPLHGSNAETGDWAVDTVKGDASQWFTADQIFQGTPEPSKNEEPTMEELIASLPSESRPSMLQQPSYPSGSVHGARAWEEADNNPTYVDTVVAAPPKQSSPSKSELPPSVTTPNRSSMKGAARIIKSKGAGSFASSGGSSQRRSVGDVFGDLVSAHSTPAKKTTSTEQALNNQDSYVPQPLPLISASTLPSPPMSVAPSPAPFTATTPHHDLVSFKPSEFRFPPSPKEIDLDVADVEPEADPILAVSAQSPRREIPLEPEQIEKEASLSELDLHDEVSLLSDELQSTPELAASMERFRERLERVEARLGMGTALDGAQERKGSSENTVSPTSRPEGSARGSGNAGGNGVVGRVSHFVITRALGYFAGIPPLSSHKTNTPSAADGNELSESRHDQEGSSASTHSDGSSDHHQSSKGSGPVKIRHAASLMLLIGLGVCAVVFKLFIKRAIMAARYGGPVMGARTIRARP